MTERGAWPIHNCDQIRKALAHQDIGDVSAQILACRSFICFGSVCGANLLPRLKTSGAPLSSAFFYW